MNCSNLVVIFGGADAEAAEARLVALAAGCRVATATLAGKPVSGGNAYKADGFQLEGELGGEITEAVIFECNPACAGSLKVVAKCDHHNPGDYGYGMGSDQYFEASSLGQLMTFLGLNVTGYERLIAASDHCPAQAYQGLCPGITPEAFREHRLAEKVAFYATNPKLAHKATREALEAVIAEAVTRLRSAELVDGVRDLRSAGFVEELSEAALQIGEAYMAAIPDTDREGNKTGNMKIVLGGHTSPQKVQAFMAWAATLPNKIGEPYGNPTRGFAGVIVKL